MKRAIPFVGIVSALLLAGVARAQGDVGGQPPSRELLVLNWEPTRTLGDFNKYIGGPSYRGFSIEGRRFLTNALSFGISASWNRFRETKDLETVSITNGTISGPVYRAFDMFAVRALAHLYARAGALRPYLGAGIGGSWDFDYQQVTDLTHAHDSFDFVVSPEIGLLYSPGPAAHGAGLNLALRYTYTTAPFGSQKNTQMVTAAVGVTFGD